MLLQTNSYLVPPDKRSEHERLIRRFRQCMVRLGCDEFDVYEQAAASWVSGQPTGRFVQIMRFRDRKHQLAVQNAERTDATAQALIAEFCDLINFPYQQQQGLFVVGFYTSLVCAPSAQASWPTQPPQQYPHQPDASATQAQEHAQEAPPEAQSADQLAAGQDAQWVQDDATETANPQPPAQTDPHASA
jgi:hypothetical protein